MKHTDHARSAVFHSSAPARRGGAAANALVGLLVIGAIGVGAWKLAGSGDATTEIDPEELERIVAETVGDEELGAVDEEVVDLVEMFTRAGAGAADGDPTQPAIDINRLTQDAEAFQEMIDSGEISISQEARTIFSNGGILPSHWVRVVDGKIVIANPGSSTPPYAPIEAPFVPALAYPDHTPVYPLPQVTLESERFGADGLPDTGTWRGKPAIGDLDRDGDLDLVASLRIWKPGDKGEGLHVWLNDGDGASFTASNDGLRRDLGYGGSDLADLDGDGVLDLAFACHNGYPRAWLAREENGERTWVETSAGLEGMGVCTDVALADLTGDGVPELACMGFFSGTGGLYVYSFDRERSVWFLLDELLVVEDYGYQVRADDVDGDGDLELLATTNQGVRIVHWEDGAFVDRSEGMIVPVIGGTLMQVLPVDLDGDGPKELLVLGWHNLQGFPVTLHRFDPEAGAWTQVPVDLPDTESIDDGELVEIDGDPGNELFLLGREGMLLADLEADGSIRVLARISEPNSRYHVQVADLDGDGLHEGIVVERGGVQIIDLAATLAAARGQ